MLCAGLRTPMGHVSKGLSEFTASDLMAMVLREILVRSKLDPVAIEEVIVGWVGQDSHAPNLARVAALMAGIPAKALAFTVHANCISGLESIISCARRILSGEGELYLAGGTESMSNFPYTIRGNRGLKSLRNLENVRQFWEELPGQAGVAIVDTIEEGLGDPVKKTLMAVTAEIVAQMLDIPRERQDEFALESYRRALGAIRSGKYDYQIMPVKHKDGSILEHDENPQEREGLVKNPERFGKAPVLFPDLGAFFKEYAAHLEGVTYTPSRKPTLTIFNVCGRSDGAAAVIVTTDEAARRHGLEIQGEIIGWGFAGMNPAHMGLSPAHATATALRMGGVTFDDLGLIELHEPFAATVLGIFKVGEKQYGQRWEPMWRDGRVNRHGGTIALGHPLAMTGTRIVLDLLADMRQDPSIHHGLAAACAAGGLGGALLIKRYE